MTPEPGQLHEDPAPPVDETRLPLHRAAIRASACFVAAGGGAAAVLDLSLLGPAVRVIALSTGLSVGLAAALLCTAEQVSPRLPWQWRPPLLIGAAITSMGASLASITWIYNMVTAGADRAVQQLELLADAGALRVLAPGLPVFVVPVLFLGLARLGPLVGRRAVVRCAGCVAVGAVGGAAGDALHDALWPPAGLIDLWNTPVDLVAYVWAAAGAGLVAGEALERRLAARLAQRDE